ncbi:MAG: alpha/beta hydrolase, partial [Beijerinckiaceae bacterium]
MRIDLEAEYNNRARVPEHPEIIAGWAADAAAYREVHAAALQSTITYGPSPRQVIDIFAAAEPLADALPVMFMHGGYWQALEPSFFSHMARGLNARGVTVGTAGYDLCPDVTIGAIAGQMRRAALLFAMTQKAERLVVTGHSA